MKKTVSTIAAAAMLAACSMSTRMNVSVTDFEGNTIEGANVLVDGRSIGQTPDASIEVSNRLGDLPMIRVWKDGYRPVNTQATGEIKISQAVTGVFFLIPLFWVYGPKAEQNILMISAKN